MLEAVERYVLGRKRPVTSKQIAEYFLISRNYASLLLRTSKKIGARKVGRENYYSERYRRPSGESSGQDHGPEVL